MSDYLFDKEGEPDREVEQLEAVLGGLRYRGAPPPLPARRAGRSRRPLWVAAGVAAVAASIVALLIAAPWRGRRLGEPGEGWAATVRDGAATIDGRALRGAARLPVGAWLETTSGRVRLAVAELGTVELAPGGRARIVASGTARHELQLARGTVAAVIVAPPRHFVVSTPSAVVTDLGCAFEIAVDEAGRGRVVVTAGRVAVSGGGAGEVVVDAGAGVELSDRGPGAPFALEAAGPGVQPPSELGPPPSSAPTPTQTETRTQAPKTKRAPSATAKPAPSATAKVPWSPTAKVPASPTARTVEPHAAAPSHRAPHATTAPLAPRLPAAAKAPAASPTRTPLRPTADPPPQVEHNPLRALEHSVE